MQFRELPSRGLFKIVLIIDYLISVIMMPIFALGYFIEPESFTINRKLSFEVATMTFENPLELPGNLFLIPMALIIVFIVASIKTAFLYLLAQKTPIGHIKIS